MEKKRLVFSHLDRKSLVNKGFIIEQKYFALVRIKNEFFISRAKPTGRFDVFFVLTVSCRFFCELITDIAQELRHL